MGDKPRFAGSLGAPTVTYVNKQLTVNGGSYEAQDQK